MIRHTVSRIGRWMLASSADMMGINLSIDDYFASLVLGGSVGAWLHFSAFVAPRSAVILASVFAALVFLLNRRILAAALPTNAACLIRYRYAFHLLCAAGVVLVVSTPAFQTIFTSVSASSVSHCLVILVFALAVRYFASGVVWTLLLAWFLVGGLATQGLPVLVAIPLILMPGFFFRYKLGRFDYEYLAGADLRDEYIDEMRSLGQRMLVAARLRVVSFLSVVLGFVVAFAVQVLIAHSFAGFVELQSIVSKTVVEFRSLTTERNGADLTISVVSVFLTLAGASRAYGVWRSLPGLYLAFYAIMLVLPIFWQLGVFTQFIPFPANSATSSALMPSLLLSIVLVVSGAVLLIELCEFDLGMRGTSSASLHRRLHALLAFLFSGSVLGAVLAIALH